MADSSSSHNVWVCMTVVGDRRYHDAARLALRSVLRNSPFPVFMGVDTGERPLWTEHPRVVTTQLSRWSSSSKRPMFLSKFDTLSALVKQEPRAVIMQMDADAILARNLAGADVVAELKRHPFAMLEQAAVIGSGNDRSFFLEHYVNHTMAWFGDKRAPPRLHSFRYYNSGVLLCTAEALTEFLQWCKPSITSKPDHHRVGQHMIADQDYLQYWLNTVHPGMCRSLPWFWNHCEHWHDGFPRPGARVYHFSNFCHGPDATTTARMSHFLEYGRDLT